MKYLIIPVVAIFAVGCASRQPKQDPEVAVAGTQADMETSGKVSDDAIKNLQEAIENTEKHLDEGEKGKK